MTDLSPAAQAVLDAWTASENGVYLLGDPERLAAALRAAADQVAPEQLAEPRGTGFRWGGWAAEQGVRSELLAIATELENANDH